MGVRFRSSKNRIVGDIIPFFDNNTYHIFYLKAYQDNCGWMRFHSSWGHIETNDFKNFQIRKDAISPGKNGDDDEGGCFTGSVIKNDNNYYLYYATFCPGSKTGREKINLAISSDGENFEKYKNNPLLTVDGKIYGGGEDFRDPFVFYNEEEKCFWMLFTSGVIHAPCITRRGVIGLAKSKNLVDWEFSEPIYTPNIYPSLECPDLFKIGDIWYLLFSQFGRTEYRMSSSPYGPWEIPIKPCFDCGEYFFYAAKTLYDGKRRLLIGWCGELLDGKDARSALWGNIMVTPREIIQKENGELSLICPKEHLDCFNSESPPIVMLPVYGKFTNIDNNITFKKSSSFAACVSEDDGFTNYSASFYVNAKSNTGSYGMILKSTKDLTQAYILEINIASNMMYLKRFQSKALFSGVTVNMEIVLCEKNLQQKADNLGFTIFFKENILEVFAGQVTLTIPLNEIKSGHVGFCATNLEANFSEIKILICEG